MDTIRSFIAIEIPPPLRSRLAELQLELKRAAADVKWVRPEGVHFTLKFLGSIGEDDVDRISLALSPLVEKCPPFELRVKGLGGFPSSRNPRVIWVGMDQGTEVASSLQREIEQKLSALGFPPETRPFSPHLTLGRIRSSKGMGSLAQSLQTQKDVELGNFFAREVFLIKSDLQPSGAVYTKLGIFKMGENQDHQK